MMTLTHHDLCFGCGRANVFGLQIELERGEDGSVSGRFFVKQDHQGPPGFAHPGVLGAALDEAMALAALEEGRTPLTVHLEVDLRAPAPVGAFVRLQAAAERPGDWKRAARASAYREDDGALVAQARALLRCDDAGAAGAAGSHCDAR
jgi:acyl-coenzyme A thioesterase PaaI-like protein